MNIATKFDVRVAPHLMRRGELQRVELEAHLSELPDEADEAVETETRFATPFAHRDATDDEEQ